MPTISMRELQKMSASKLQALPHAVPIKNGRETVAVLVPVNNPGSAEYWREAFERIDRAAAARTPEENAAIDALLAERGID